MSNMVLFQIHAAGFASPTPIQAQTWPIALQNRDIVAIAKTGSGKTLGYLIPAFMLLRFCRNNPQNGPTVVVLAPTRELATQIQDEAIKFGRSSRVSCTVSRHYLFLLFWQAEQILLQIYIYIYMMCFDVFSVCMVELPRVRS